MRLLLLSTLITLSSLSAAAPPFRGQAGEDEALLAEHRIGIDGASCLAFLRKRYAGVTDARIKELIEELGEDSFDAREEASRQLILLGIRAKALLIRAREHADLEVRSRAARCLEEVEKSGSLSLQVTAAAIRQLGRTRPTGAASLLLACLESVEDDALAAEMREALVAGVLAGKPDPVLVKALTSKSARQRLAAAVALARSDDHLPSVRKLLADPDLGVRVRTALALLERGEREPLAILAAAMEDAGTRETAGAEEVLFRLAGERSPSLDGNSPASRRKYRAAWEAWVKDHGAKADLASLKEHARLAGFTTVVLLDENEVIDLDAGNRVRWRITGLMQPLDVQRLSGERILVAEHAGNRVTERDSRGTILWKHEIVGPLSAQRLPNGNTFIATKPALIELDPRGREVWRYTRPAGEQFMRARRLPGGDTVMVSQLGVCWFIRIDRFSKEVKRFGAQIHTSGGRIDLTPAGNVLIPEMYNNRVVERDMDGAEVREIKIPQPISALSLPGGNVIITSMTQRRAVEIDRAGKEVWEYKRDTRVTRAVRY